MFGGLKEKLQAARNRLGSSIQGAIATQAPPAPETRASGPSASTASQKPISSAAPTFVDKVKILIIDRELVVS
jgi:fused signal recognition particle receptor